MKKMIENNYNFNQEIQKNKSFKNPRLVISFFSTSSISKHIYLYICFLSIYEKFIEHYNLDEFGSSFQSVGLIFFLIKSESRYHFFHTLFSFSI